MNRMHLSPFILFFTLLLVACGIHKTGANNTNNPIQKEISEANTTNGSSVNALNTVGQLVNKDTIIIQQRTISAEQVAIEFVFVHQEKEYILHDTIAVGPDYSMWSNVENEKYELSYYRSYLNATSDETYTFGIYDGELILEEVVFEGEDRYWSSFMIMRPFKSIANFSELMDLKEQAINFELPRSQRTGHLDLAPADSIFRTFYQQKETSQFQLLTDKETLLMLHGTFNEATSSEMHLPNIEHYNNIAFYLEQMGAEQEALEIQKNIDENFPERKWGLIDNLNTKTGILERYQIDEFNKCYVSKKGEQMFLVDVNKGTFVKNETLIKKVDENCVSTGFNHVFLEELFFTIQQQTCGERFIINEFITFQMDTTTNIAYLHKFEMDKIDESNPDNKFPLQTLTTEDFGKVSFAEADTKKLYTLFP